MGSPSASEPAGHNMARLATVDRARAIGRIEAVEVMKWPACYPDLSPIEHVWSYLKHKVYPRMDAASTMADLGGLIQQEWDNLPQAYIGKLVYSMRKRCQQCHNNKHTVMC